MMPHTQYSRALKFASFVTLLTFAFVQPLFAQQNSRQNVTNFAKNLRQVQPSLLAKISNDSLLTKKMAVQKPLSVQPISDAFLQKEVVLEDGSTAKLGSIVRGVAADQAELFQNGQQATAMTGVLADMPLVEDAVIEFSDSFTIVRSTTVMVNEPQAFAQISPTYKDFLGTGPTGYVTKSELTPEMQAGLEKFMLEEVPNLPPNDPLRLAAEQGGEEGLLRAVSEGKGKFEIIDTLNVPKKAFKSKEKGIQKPKLLNGVLIFTESEPRHVTREDADRAARMIESMEEEETEDSEPQRGQRQSEPPMVEPPGFSKSGSQTYKTEFLTGFTRDATWDWERRWNFGVGFFRISLFGSYRVGMRIPIAVDGRVEPTDIQVKDVRDREVVFVNQIRAGAVAEDAGFFRATELPNHQVFDGHEGVFGVGIGWGYKLNLFWMDLLDEPRSWILDFSHDTNFSPPFGPDQTGFDIKIPASLTGTELDLGVLWGSAQVGFNVGGHGTVKLDMDTYLASKQIDSRTLEFGFYDYQSVRLSLPAMSSAPWADYGFILSRPKYTLDVTITPEVKFDAGIGYRGFSKHIGTRWIRLNSLRVSLGRKTFKLHPDTRRSFRFKAGTKRFTRIEENSQPAVVPIISNHSNKYVSVGEGDQAQLTASNHRMTRSEQFQIFELGNNEAAIRSVRQGKYVSVGPPPRFYLHALSDEIGNAQKFSLETVSLGIYAFRSKRSGKYVRAGMGDESYLGAISDSISDWEKFRFAKPVIATTAQNPGVQTATFVPRTISTTTATSRPPTLMANPQNVASATLVPKPLALTATSSTTASNTTSNKKPTASGVTLTGYKKK